MKRAKWTTFALSVGLLSITFLLFYGQLEKLKLYLIRLDSRRNFISLEPRTSNDTPLHLDLEPETSRDTPLHLDLKCFLSHSHNYSKEDLKDSDFEFLKTEDGKEYKIILAYYYAYGPNFEFGFGREPFEKGCCNEKRCFITARKNVLPLTSFDAVIIHLRDIDRVDLTLTKERAPHQRYILYERESPSHSYDSPMEFNDFFNWTMTYRGDSDIPAPYGYILPKRMFRGVNLSVFESSQSVASTMKTKLKAAVWVVSNCHANSSRMAFVEELQQYIKVDMYGKCGIFACPVAQEAQCNEMFAKTYKFYLALENSIWAGYVTEKFYRTLSYNIVPVVLGGGNYTAIAPPHSYIDASDFPSVKELAKYLNYLDKNNTAYMEYFRWKKEYFVIGIRGNQLVYTPAFCKLCEKLHQDSSQKIYSDLQDWFIDRAKILKKNDY